MRKIILLITALGLAACHTPPTAKRDTYDEIKSEIGQSASAGTKPSSSEAVAAALLPPLNIEIPKAKAPVEERFSLSFSNVPANQFFNAIVSGTRYNMLVHPDVGGTISANLKDVTLFEALDAIRDLYGYDYQVEGNRITIRPLTMQTRVFQVNYLTGNRRGTSDTRVTSNSALTLLNNNSNNGSGSNSSSGQQGSSNTNNGTTNNQQSSNSGNNNGNNNNGNNNGSNGNLPSPSFPSPVDSAKISTSSSSDFWGDVRTALEAIVGKDGGRSIVISPQSGVIVVHAMPEELRNVSAYLKASQLSVDRQVILEAKILEVQLNSSYQTGINWASFPSFRGNSGTGVIGFGQPGTVLQASSNGAATPLQTIGATAISALTGAGFNPANSNSGSVFGLALQTSNFAALISFLESQGTVHVLSNPRIATLNNQKAVLKVGSDDFFVTGVSTTTTTGSTANTTTPNVTLEPFFSGVVLDVTPQIDAEGNIILHVHPAVTKVTSVSQTINLGTAGTLVLPLASSATQETDSIVRGLDGHIVAIGGLMRQNSVADRSQLPGVGDIPLVGALFRNTDQTTTKSELVILIKPTIVKDDGAWDQNVLESQRRVQDLDPRNATRFH